jgi:hypothetical protein
VPARFPPEMLCLPAWSLSFDCLACGGRGGMRTGGRVNYLVGARACVRACGFGQKVDCSHIPSARAREIVVIETVWTVVVDGWW